MIPLVRQYGISAITSLSPTSTQSKSRNKLQDSPPKAITQQKLLMVELCLARLQCQSFSFMRYGKADTPLEANLNCKLHLELSSKLFYSLSIMFLLIALSMHFQCRIMPPNLTTVMTCKKPKPSIQGHHVWILLFAELHAPLSIGFDALLMW